MPAGYPILNGIAPSWADARIRLSPEGSSLLDVEDIKAINTSIGLEIGVQRSHGAVKRRTTGDASPEASITLYRTGYDTLLRELVKSAPSQGNRYRVALVVFDIAIQFTPIGSDDIYETRIMGCRIKGRTANAAEGTDPSEVEVPLSVVDIVDVIDGKDVVLL